MKTFSAMILGCKVNDYEATCIINKLKEKYVEVSFDSKADFYLIFTCCVTNIAEAKTRKYIHKARRENPDAYIVAIGCLGQIKGDELIKEGVDLVIGSSKKDKVVDMIIDHLEGNLSESLDNLSFEPLYLNDYPNKSRAFLKIQDGCNQFCNYCVIPYTRGRERSFNHNEVIQIAKCLSRKYNEIVLTGIHTGRYFDGEYHLYDLLKAMLSQTNIKTIRLSSIEMNEVNDEIINLIKQSNGRIAHHLHVPVQACTDEVLKLMGRPYSFEDYYQFVIKIRKEIPDISISTDLIVGFPQETDELFVKNVDNIKKINFSFIHCFPYSRKEKTVADKMSGHIDPKTKKERVNTVYNVQKEITNNFNKTFINKDVEVLIEKFDGIYSYGYSKQYFYVSILGAFKIGEIIKVKIIDVMNDKIIGEYVS